MGSAFYRLFFLGTVFILALHWQCGSKKSDENFSSSPYVPNDWDGVSDWSSSSYTIRDLN